MLVDAHDDAIEHDLLRRESGQSLVEEGLELSKSLRAYTRAAWHVIKPEIPFKDNWHIGAMCEHFEAVTDGEIRNLAVWVPPGSMKTITGSISWPTWVWTRQPWFRFLICMYDMDIAIETGSVPARDLIRSEWYEARFGHIFQLKGDLNKKAVYFNNRGGARFTAAPNAKKVTSRHAHVIMLDDPNDANSAEWNNEAELERVNNWHDSTLPTRFADPMTGAKVLIQQRLHEKDLSGHLIDETWTVLCLPERYNAAHPYAWRSDPRVQGDLLWPSRIGEAENQKRVKEMGGHRASAQLQQEPAAREGEILKRAYWRYYPERFLHALEEGDLRKAPWGLPAFRMIVYSWDTSFKDRTQNDPVAGGVWGIIGGDRYLLRTRYERMSLSATKTAMLELREWGLDRFPRAAHVTLVEKKSNGVEIIAQMRRIIPGLRAYNPGNLDKTQRAENAEPDLESGNVFICGESNGEGTDYDPLQTPAWSQEVVDQCAKFPKGSNDDLVDMTTQLVNETRRLTSRRARAHSPAETRLPQPAGIPTGAGSILGR